METEDNERDNRIEEQATHGDPPIVTLVNKLLKSMNITEYSPTVPSLLIEYYQYLVTYMAENTHKVNQHTNIYTNSEPTAPSIETVNFVFEQLRSTMRTVMDPSLVELAKERNSKPLPFDIAEYGILLPSEGIITYEENNNNENNNDFNNSLTDSNTFSSTDSQPMVEPHYCVKRRKIDFTLPNIEIPIPQQQQPPPPPQSISTTSIPLSSSSQSIQQQQPPPPSLQSSSSSSQQFLYPNINTINNTNSNNTSVNINLDNNSNNQSQMLNNSLYNDDIYGSNNNNSNNNSNSNDMGNSNTYEDDFNSFF